MRTQSRWASSERPRTTPRLSPSPDQARGDPPAAAVDRPRDVVFEERLREPPVPVRAVAVPATGVAEREDLRAAHADDLEPRRARGEVRRERVPLSDVVVRVAFVQEDGALRAEPLRKPRQLPGAARADRGSVRQREAVVVDQDDRPLRIGVPVERAPGEVALDRIGGTRRGQKRERREERERTGRHSGTEPRPILARTPPVGYDGAREREPDLPQ